MQGGRVEGRRPTYRSQPLLRVGAASSSAVGAGVHYYKAEPSLARRRDFSMSMEMRRTRRELSTVLAGTSGRQRWVAVLVLARVGVGGGHEDGGAVAEGGSGWSLGFLRCSLPHSLTR